MTILDDAASYVHTFYTYSSPSADTPISNNANTDRFSHRTGAPLLFVPSLCVHRFTEQGDPDRQAVELRPALKRAQAAYHAKLKAAPDDISSSSPISFPPVSASSSASSTSSNEHGDNDGESDAFLSTNDSDTPDGLKERHSAQYGHAPTGTATKSADCLLYTSPSPRD